MTKPVEIVEITSKSSLFKKGTGEAATAIELINFSFFNPEDGEYSNECGFNIVSQKDLYSIGDKAIYIQPDYCVPDTEMFSSFIAPGGDPNKSKLGKNGRIRAVKFNFNKENSSDIVYSNGILLPFDEVCKHRTTAWTYSEAIDILMNMTDFLGITKYEEPERFGTGNSKGSLPGFLYKTDEENAANLKSHINRVLEAGEYVGYSLKIDGSSFSQYFRKTEEGWITGICSRTLEKKGVDDPNSTTDPWVKLSHSSGLYERGMEYCKKTGRELVFRGEIYGEGLKGSGNKLNPHSKEKPTLAIFGIDDLVSGYATKLLPSEVGNICRELDLNYIHYSHISPKNYDELIDIANNFFKFCKNECSRPMVIEGVVVRTLNSNNLSCKILNEEYDSKK